MPKSASSHPGRRGSSPLSNTKSPMGRECCREGSQRNEEQELHHAVDVFLLLKKGPGMFFQLGRIVTRYRWLIVGVWMVAIAIALPFAPQATQILHSGGFVNPDFESEQAITLLAQKLHFDPTIVQVIFTSQRISADSPAFAQEAQQALT
jgi:hypothetical protein